MKCRLTIQQREVLQQYQQSKNNSEIYILFRTYLPEFVAVKGVRYWQDTELNIMLDTFCTLALNDWKEQP